jgi:hypothetical protein
MVSTDNSSPENFDGAVGELMINIRYYVFLLVGIFLAMGLGMMIGITLENQNIIENQQAHLIRQIEDRFVSLRSESEQLKMELGNMEAQKEQLQQLSSLLLTELIRDRLTGKNVAIISFSQQAPMNTLLDFFSITGASVQSAVTIFPETTVDMEGTAGDILQPDEFMAAMIEEWLYSVCCGDKMPSIQEAEELMLVSYTGQYEYPVDMIILAVQDTSTLDYDHLLIHSALDANIPMVVVDTGEIDNSAMPLYKEMGVSTVDHVETIYGRLALACVLSGNRGNYGFGSNALDQLPSPLFSDPYSNSDDLLTTIGGELP